MPLGIGMYKVAGLDFAVKLLLYSSTAPVMYAVTLVCRSSEVFHYVV